MSRYGSVIGRAPDLLQRPKRLKAKLELLGEAAVEVRAALLSGDKARYDQAVLEAHAAMMAYAKERGP